MAREKKKKIDFARESFSVSIGEAMGATRPAAASSGMKDEPAASTQKAAADAGRTVAPVALAQQFTLHRESSGRGGRIVTLVSVKPPLAPNVAETLAKAMRKGLGCGSHVEGGRIVLQGDIQERAEQWLLKQGARRVVMGN